MCKAVALLCQVQRFWRFLSLYFIDSFRIILQLPLLSVTEILSSRAGVVAVLEEDDEEEEYREDRAYSYSHS